MAFFECKNYGRLYVIKLVLPDDTIVHKVGMTNSNRAADRMLEILRSWFMRYRFVPYAELRLNREVANPLDLEKLAHKVLSNYQWIPDKKIDGGTEMFTGLEEIRLLHFLRHLETNQDTEGVEQLGKLLEVRHG